MDVHPNISIVDIEERNTYECVIFSDGVSDMLINNDELIPLIQGRNQAQNIVEFAKSRWEQEWNYKIKGYRETANQKINGIDDITAIYIRF